MSMRWIFRDSGDKVLTTVHALKDDMSEEELQEIANMNNFADGWTATKVTYEEYRQIRPLHPGPQVSPLSHKEKVVQLDFIMKEVIDEMEKVSSGFKNKV